MLKSVIYNESVSDSKENVIVMYTVVLERCSDGWTIFPIFLFFYHKVCTDNYLKFLTFALCREKNSL